VPLQKLQYRPGVSRESTDLANEGGWYSCDKIRFRSGQPENLRGWTTSGIATGTFAGVCRNLVEWATLAVAGTPSFLLLGVGTNLKYYVLANQTFFDITPLAKTSSLGANPFAAAYSTLSAGISSTATTIPVTSATSFSTLLPIIIQINNEQIYVPAVSGNSLVNCTRGYNNTTATSHSSTTPVSSSCLVVSSTANGSAVGNYVTFQGASTAVGPVPTTVLNQGFKILAESANYITIDTGIQSTSATSGGGSSVIAYYDIATGADINTSGQGWGAGVWTEMAFSGASSTLTSILSSSATTITVASTAGFSASGYVVIEAEVIQYTSIVSNTFQGCTRGTSGNATTHGSGRSVKQVTYFSPTYDISTSPLARAWNTPAISGVNIPVRIWSAASFGQDLVMNIRNGGVYYWKAGTNLASSGNLKPLPDGRAVTLQSLAPSDPAVPIVGARVLVTEQRHIVVLGVNDYTAANIQDPMLIAWCDQEDPTIWTPTAVNTAGTQRMTYGSKLITGEITRQETLIWSDSAVYSMQYLGPPFTFGFNTISNEVTIAGPNCVTTANNITYWMGIDKFYVYSGRVDTLPCSLRQYVFDDINNSQLDQVYAGTNEKYNEIWWFYCSSTSSQIDRYVIYNYLEKLWYYGQMPRSAWYDSHIRTYPVAAYPKSAEFEVTSVDDVGAILSLQLIHGGDYDTIPANVPLNAVGGSGAGASLLAAYSGRAAVSANVSTGGEGYAVGDHLTITGGIPTGNLLLQDYGVNDVIETGNPQPINSYIESADFDLGEGDSYSFIKRLIPDIDFIGSTTQTPSVTMVVSTRNFPGQGVFQQVTPEIVATTQQVTLQVYDYTPDIWIRLRGRQVAFTIGSNNLGVKWQLGLPRLDITPDGRKSK